MGREYQRPHGHQATCKERQGPGNLSRRAGPGGCCSGRECCLGREQVELGRPQAEPEQRRSRSSHSCRRGACRHRCERRIRLGREQPLRHRFADRPAYRRRATNLRRRIERRRDRCLRGRRLGRERPRAAARPHRAGRRAHDDDRRQRPPDGACRKRPHDLCGLPPERRLALRWDASTPLLDRPGGAATRPRECLRPRLVARAHPHQRRACWLETLGRAGGRGARPQSGRLAPDGVRRPPDVHLPVATRYPLLRRTGRQGERRAVLLRAPVQVEGDSAIAGRRLLPSDRRRGSL